MSMKMHVVLEGLPERIQEAADILDRAFPEAISWRHLAKQGLDHAMRLEGVTEPGKVALHRLSGVNPPAISGRIWKLSSSAAQEVQQGNRFCASLSRSLRS